MGNSTSLSIKQVKAETLCLGIKLADIAKQQILNNHPNLLEQKQIHAAHLFLNKRTPVNAVFGERFTQLSPYELKWEGNEFWLYRNDEPCFPCIFLPSPKWYFMKTSFGNSMNEIFSVHGLRTLALSSYTRCDYVNNGEACKFCSVSPGIIHDERRLDEIREVLLEAFHENPNYTVALSEGARRRPDRGGAFHSKMVEVVKNIKSDVSISVELVPPESNTTIDELINRGATSLIMNLELYDEKLRKLLMPAKSLIKKTKYYESWEYAVNKLGKGNVSSVVIFGIERYDQTLQACNEMVERGVIPTVIPFRPYDNSEMANFRLTSPQEYLAISEIVSELIKKNSLNPYKQLGCTECGACSLEINYEYVY